MRWPIFLLVVAFAAALVGYGSVIPSIEGIAKIIYLIAAGLFILTLVFRDVRKKEINPE